MRLRHLSVLVISTLALACVQGGCGKEAPKGEPAAEKVDKADKPAEGDKATPAGEKEGAAGDEAGAEGGDPSKAMKAPGGDEPAQPKDSAPKVAEPKGDTAGAKAAVAPAAPAGNLGELVSKLPAEVTAVAAVDVGYLLPPKAIELITKMTQMGAKGTEAEFVEEMVPKIQSLAIVLGWEAQGDAKTDEPAPKADCKAVAKKMLDMATEGRDIELPPEALASMEKSCEKDLDAAQRACIMKVDELSEMGECMAGRGGGSREGEPQAFVVKGTFDAGEVVGMIKGLGVAAAKKLGEGVVVIAPEAEVAEAIAAAWDKPAAGAARNVELGKVLARGLAKPVALYGGLTMPDAPAEAIGATVLSLSASDVIKLQLWTHVKVEAMKGELRKGIEVMKTEASGMSPKDLDMLNAMGVPTEGFGELMNTVKALAASASVEDKDGGMWVKAEAKGDLRALINTAMEVAIPAAIERYMARAKTTEAIDQIDKIFKGAAYYYSAPKVDVEGNKLPCQFPATVACSPDTKPCEGEDKRFAADPEVWNDATWAALSFEMRDAHYFKYCFESKGTGAEAEATISAHADLDCDGEWSTFRRTIMADPDAPAEDCNIKGSPAFFVDKETE